jgi:aldehyde dehydrogenase (NAD+)
MQNVDQFRIGGRWVEPLGMDTHPLVNSADEQPIAHIPMASEEDVNVAVAAARAAFDTCSMPFKRRSGWRRRRPQRGPRPTPMPLAIRRQTWRRDLL